MDLSERERAERFIELYRRIEDKLSEKYAGRRIKYSSVIMQFINEPEGAEFSDELNTCREIRNILIHRPDVAGGPPLIPSDGTIGVLNAILDYLNAPPPAIDYATPASRILKTNFEQNVTQIMRTMNKRDFRTRRSSMKASSTASFRYRQYFHIYSTTRARRSTTAFGSARLRNICRSTSTA